LLVTKSHADGLMNQWKFSDDFVRAVYNANVAAGVDYMEHRLLILPKPP